MTQTRQTIANSARRSTRRIFLDNGPVRCRFVAAAAPEPGSSPALPLLLIHGLGCSSDAWLPTLRCLERRGLSQPVLAPDMPGYGHSPGPPEALGMDALADWNARLLDQLGIERVAASGNSMGCQVALALARRHPDRVGGLVLVGPTTGAGCESPGRYALGLLLDSCRESLTYNLTLLRMCRQMGARRYLETVREMLRDDPLAHAAAVRAPTLILRGERDAIVPDAVARRLAEALPQAAYQIVPGAAHAVQFTRPEAFTRAALAFLTAAPQATKLDRV